MSDVAYVYNNAWCFCAFEHWTTLVLQCSVRSSRMKLKTPFGYFLQQASKQRCVLCVYSAGVAAHVGGWTLPVRGGRARRDGPGRPPVPQRQGAESRQVLHGAHHGKNGAAFTQGANLLGVGGHKQVNSAHHSKNSACIRSEIKCFPSRVKVVQHGGTAPPHRTRNTSQKAMRTVESTVYVLRALRYVVVYIKNTLVASQRSFVKIEVFIQTARRKALMWIFATLRMN